MPIYEYICKKCDTVFSMLKTLNSKEETVCPACGSAKVAKKISSFSSMSSSGFIGADSYSSGGG